MYLGRLFFYAYFSGYNSGCGVLRGTFQFSLFFVEHLNWVCSQWSISGCRVLRGTMTACDDPLIGAVVTLCCVLRGTFDADLFSVEQRQRAMTP
jgi:hypothetical protein